MAAFPKITGYFRNPRTRVVCYIGPCGTVWYLANNGPAWYESEYARYRWTETFTLSQREVLRFMKSTAHQYVTQCDRLIHGYPDPPKKGEAVAKVLSWLCR